MRWSGWLATAIAVVAVSFLVVGGVMRAQRGPEDFGRLVRESRELYLEPSTVMIIATSRAKWPILEKATRWWNASGIPYTFHFRIDDPAYHSLSSLSTTARYGFVLLDVAQVPNKADGASCGGRTIPVFDIHTGAIYTASVVLNILYEDDERTMVAVAEHELGHVLGLDDDPLPGLDLNSIMRRSLNPGGILTPHDRRILNWRPHAYGRGARDTFPVAGVHRSRAEVPQHQADRDAE